MDGEWIYVLMTSSDYDRFKIGYTRNDPIKRMKHLRTGDPGIGFQVAYFVPNSVGKARDLEKKLHNMLGNRVEFHDGGVSEWFPGDPRDAYFIVESVFDELGIPITDCFDPNGNMIVRFWEEGILSFFGPAPIVDEYGIPWDHLN
ncbi:GIY-YIG nuclease family protein [Pseudoalteromonas sp. ZZD1]|uniref:GIY-YIG nuclease family protein n=1 Tax=Pseudoalteromonas sp. ZZD1 TaxID=3139395 RepID=UPI003BAAB497